MPSNLKQAVEEAIKDMVTVEHYKNGNGVYKSVVSLPPMYPSGASVCIEVMERDEENFLITDMGGGFNEAVPTGSPRSYTWAAEEEIKGGGMAMINGEICVYAHKSKLQGAIVTVANASLKAVDRAINTKG